MLFILSSCKKEPTTTIALPAATQVGKNTIGFTVNGEVWLPYAECSAFGNPCRQIGARYGPSNGGPLNGIDFGFQRIINGKMSSLLIASNFATITTIGEKIDSVGVTYGTENSSGGHDYYESVLAGSKFTVTKIDFSEQIISGEFNFNLMELDGSHSTISIKDGRFDFKFNACLCNQ